MKNIPSVKIKLICYHAFYIYLNSEKTILYGVLFAQHAVEFK